MLYISLSAIVIHYCYPRPNHGCYANVLEIQTLETWNEASLFTDRDVMAAEFYSTAVHHFPNPIKAPRFSTPLWQRCALTIDIARSQMASTMFRPRCEDVDQLLMHLNGLLIQRNKVANCVHCRRISALGNIKAV